jgi:predicted nucleic acid-binding protein
MTIYADTSVLVSYLYPGDAQHARARGFFRQQSGADWITSPWSRFETINTLRQLCLHLDPARKASRKVLLGLSGRAFCELTDL